MRFKDRLDAGRRLSAKLAGLREEHPVVLGVPRGGVPVALTVATELDAPMDVIVVRKLGVPFQPELAMGAVGEGGVRVHNLEIIAALGITREQITAVEEREEAEVVARARRFRGGREPVPLAGRTAVLVDDGIATGSTMLAACRVVRALGASRVVVAVPVASPDAVQRVRADADEVICLHTPRRFVGVGQWYVDFSPTSDREVARLISAARATPTPAAEEPALQDGAAGADRPRRDEEVTVHSDGLRLTGHLTVPTHSAGLVIFAHGSGSSRHSPRNRSVAEVLQEAGLATLLFDLLTPAEAARRARVFDVDLLAGRLLAVIRWARGQSALSRLPVGYFGASTGAAAALIASATSPVDVAAVVSRGGRPDLAGDHLGRVRAPTLLIVGGDDTMVLGLNRRAQQRLGCVNRLAVVPGATHLFEEPGTLQAAADLACDWFRTHLVATPEHGPVA